MGKEDKLQRRMQKWARVVNVDPHWKLKLIHCDDPVAAGQVFINSERWEATIAVNKAVPSEEIDWVLVHELLELSFYEIRSSVVHLMKNLIEDDKVRTAVYAQWAGSINRFIEKMVPIILKGTE